MTDDFLAKFMGNPARARVLRVFLFDQSNTFTVGLAAKRSGVPSKVAEKEIQMLEKWGILEQGKFFIALPDGTRRVVGGKQKERAWTVDLEFKYAPALVRFVHEVSPLQHKNVLAALRRAGRLASVILTGSFMGDSSRPADLIVAADRLNERKLEQIVRRLEPKFGREIRYAAFSTSEFRYRLSIQDRLIRDTLDYPHLVLLDKTRLL
ncbi:MAG: hypothetical protein AAB804_03225 [Patescibacteria group bacterium]